MIIRRIQDSDAALWREIRLEALRTAPGAFSSRHDEWADRSIADFAARIRAAPVILALNGALPVGCISWNRDKNGDLPRRAWLTSVFVTGDARGKGLAQRLIDAAIKDAAIVGVTEIYLEVGADNVAAQATYRRAGFLPVLGPDRSRTSYSVGELTMRRDISDTQHPNIWARFRHRLSRNRIAPRDQPPHS